MTQHDIMWHLAKLMTEHGLISKGWTFKLNNRKRSLGVCKYGPRRIEISRYIISLPREEIIDTILHEIAHALVGPTHGHNHVWKAKCREIGCKPQRCADQPMNAPAKWKLVCTTCGYERKRHRRTKKVRACGQCCRRYNSGNYTEEFKLQWKANNGRV